MNIITKAVPRVRLRWSWQSRCWLCLLCCGGGGIVLATLYELGKLVVVKDIYLNTLVKEQYLHFNYSVYLYILSCFLVVGRGLEGGGEARLAYAFVGSKLLGMSTNPERKHFPFIFPFFWFGICCLWFEFCFEQHILKNAIVVTKIQSFNIMRCIHCPSV